MTNKFLDGLGITAENYIASKGGKRNKVDLTTSRLGGTRPFGEAKEDEETGFFDAALRGAKANAQGVLGGIGYAVGAEDFADTMQRYATDNARKREHDTIFSLDYITDPEGLTYDLGGNLGSMAALAPLGLLVPASTAAAGAGAIGAGLTRLGLGRAATWATSEAGKKALATGIRGAATGLGESVSEFGSTAREAHEQGLTPNPRLDNLEVLGQNLLVNPVSNALEYALLGGKLFNPTASVGETLAQRALKAPLRSAPAMGANAVQNGIEELVQQTISDKALGLPVGDIYNPMTWTDSQRQAFEVGMATGGVTAGASNIGQALLPNNKQPTSEEQEDTSEPQATTSEEQVDSRSAIPVNGDSEALRLAYEQERNQRIADNYLRQQESYLGITPYNPPAEIKQLEIQQPKIELRTRGESRQPQLPIGGRPKRRNMQFNDISKTQEQGRVIKQRQQISSVTRAADNLLLQAAMEQPSMQKPQRGLTVVKRGEVGSVNQQKEYADAPTTEGRYLRNYEQELVDNYIGNPQKFDRDYFTAVTAVKRAFRNGDLTQGETQQHLDNLRGLYDRTAQAIRNDGVIRQTGTSKPRPVTDIIRSARKRTAEMKNTAKALNDKRFINRVANNQVRTIEVPYYIQSAVRDIQEAKKAKADAERREQVFKQTKADVTEYVNETYADNRAEGIKLELEAAREGRKELFTPLVNQLKEGMGQGVTRQYTDKETGEVVDVSDLKGKEETKLNSASYNREWYSNNAPWYQNWFKANGRKPNNAELYEIAENIYLGNDEYGSGLLPFDGSQEADEALSQNKANVEYFDNLIKIYEELQSGEKQADETTEQPRQTAQEKPQQEEKAEPREVVAEQVKEPVNWTPPTYEVEDILLAEPMPTSVSDGELANLKNEFEDGFAKAVGQFVLDTRGVFKNNEYRHHYVHRNDLERLNNNQKVRMVFVSKTEDGNFVVYGTEMHIAKDRQTYEQTLHYNTKALKDWQAVEAEVKEIGKTILNVPPTWKAKWLNGGTPINQLETQLPKPMPKVALKEESKQLSDKVKQMAQMDLVKGDTVIPIRFGKAWGKDRYLLQFAHKDAPDEISSILSGNTIMIDDIETGASADLDILKQHGYTLQERSTKEKTTNEGGYIVSEEGNFIAKTNKEVLEILEPYIGKEIVNKQTNQKATFGKTGINKLISQKAYSKSNANGFDNEMHFSAAANIVKLFENATLEDVHRDNAVAVGEHSNILNVKIFEAPFSLNGEKATAKITAKESIQHGNKIYSIELLEIKKDSIAYNEAADNERQTTSPFESFDTSTLSQEAENVKKQDVKSNQNGATFKLNGVKLSQDNQQGGSDNVIYNAKELSGNDNGSRRNQDDVRGTAESEGTSRSDGQGSRTPRATGERNNGNNGVSRSGDFVGRERTVDESKNGESATGEPTSRSADRGRSVTDSEAGQSDVEQRGTETIIESVADRQVNATQEQLKENTVPNEKAGRKQKIAKSMPFLTSLQVNNTEFAHVRLNDKKEQGVMFTDGTGTGKTFSGLAIIQEALQAGKKNILIVSPSNTINNQWVKSAKEFFVNGENKPIEIHELKDVKDGGKGVCITTYANIRANEAIVNKEWDLVVCDEAHNLMSNEKGNPTTELNKVRMITYHNRGMWNRASVLVPDTDKLQQLKQERDALEEKLKKSNSAKEEYQIEQQIKEKSKEVQAEAAKISDERKKFIDGWKQIPKADKPKVVFLTATPFSYDKDIDYAEGYLFDYEDVEGSGYNQPNGYQKFMMDHFGYTMSYDKLTRPDAEVDNRVMEVNFHNWLRKIGALEGHELEIDYDYNRGFILVGQGVGAKIDEGFAFLQDNDKKYSQLLGVLQQQFDERKRQYLLESIKAQQSVNLIKEYLKAGKKVVVFHDTMKKRDLKNPFVVTDEMLDFIGSDLKKRVLVEQEMLRVERPDLFELPMQNLKSPIEIFDKAFGDNALYINGEINRNKKQANRIKAKFNSDTSGKNLIIVQKDAGNSGISLHDTTGKHQRVMIMVGSPTRPTYAIQMEGRIYRFGNKSNAIFRYLTTGTNIENYIFATTIASRASTAENLAMGDKARGLRDSFINAYAEVLDGTWEKNLPNMEGEDVGGKEADKVAKLGITPFERAKALYYSNQKKNSRTKEAEGIDYYATPEPVGFKMVEWAGLQAGNKVLEPSAGHGAISRFFSPNTDNTIIEPSGKLASVAAMNTDNAKLIQSTFENHNVVNKYDAVIMNPPFGTAGKTAMEHVAKAFKHLRNNGRLIALVPRGKMDERFDKWYESEEAKHAYKVAEIELPSVTFKRAGTSVGTRILIIDKHETKEPLTGISSKHIDLRNADNVNELFDRIENVEIPAREQYLYDGRNVGTIGDRKYSVSLAESEEYIQSKKEIIDDLVDIFGDDVKHEIQGNNILITTANGKRLLIRIEDEIILNDEEMASGKKDHAITDDTEVDVAGYWQRLTKDDVADGELVLSLRSPKGIAYHEILHAVMDLALTAKEKAALIRSATKEAKETGKDVEEVIAERYRKWVLARKRGEGTAFGKLFKKMQDFYYKLKKLFTGIENAHNVMRKIESREVWERGSENINANGSKKYLVTNNQITGDTLVPVIDVTGLPKIDTTLNSVKAAIAKNLIGKTFRIIGSNGIGRVASVSDGKHFIGSSKSDQRKVAVRQKAMNVIEDVLNNAVYIEKHTDAVHGTNNKYIELYAVVKNNKDLTRFRIVAKEGDNTAGEYEVKDAKFYDIIKDGSITASKFNKLADRQMSNDTQVRLKQNVPSTISVANLLTGVNDRNGKPYVNKLGELKYETGARKYSITPSKNKIKGITVTTSPQTLKQQVKEQGYKGWFKGLWKDFYRNWVDKNDSLHGLDEAMQMALGRPLSEEEKVYNRAQTMNATAAGRAKALIEGDGQHIKSLSEQMGRKLHNVTLKKILEFISKDTMDRLFPNYLKDNDYENWIDAFGHYLTARRLREMVRLYGDEYKLPKGITIQDIEKAIQEVPAPFKKAAQMYYDFNDNLLTILEDAGIISKEVHELLNTKYKEYCPLMRDFSDTAGADTFLNGLTTGGRGIGNVSSTLKRISLEGSERGVINPLESTIKSVAVMMNRAERNKVGQMAVKLAGEKGMENIIREIPTPKGGNAVADPKNSIFTVMFNGKKVAYQCAPELYGAIVGYNVPAAGFVLGVARSTARMLRTGATMSPSFIIRNLIRDTIFASISSQNGFIPIVDTIRGAQALLHNAELKAEFETAGVTAFNFYKDAETAYKSLVELNGGKELSLRNPIDLIKFIGRNFEQFSAFAESATRMGEFKRAREAGKSIEEATRDAKEITIDFSRSGVIGENINLYVPFFNATIQGGDKLYRLFRDNPVGTAVNVAKYIVLPSIALWCMNYDDEEYKELDPKIKMTHWIIGDVRIPKPQEAGILFGSGVEAMLDMAIEKDPKAMKLWARQVGDGLFPNAIPTILLPLIEWQANYSFFREGKLVGYREERLPDELQYKDSTSEASKALGKLTGLSPIKLDNTVRGYTGTMGMLLWQAYDFGSMDKAKLPDKKLVELPLIRDFFVNDYNTRRSVDDFYKLAEQADKQHSGYGAKGKPTAVVKGIRQAKQQISNLNKDIRNITASNLSPAEKREHIDRKREIIKRIAQRANERYSKFYD